MATKSIEEKAWDYFRPEWKGSIIDAYIAGATEQDRISRAEERERCIRMATKVYADLLSASGYDIGSINSELQRLRKAIEEGGEG